MRVCAVEIKSNEMLFCLLAKKDGLFTIPDCRQNRLQLLQDKEADSLRKLQFTLKKLVEDYRIDAFVIKERMQKGKFAGSAVGFKIEATIQLIDEVDTYILSSTEQKEILKRNPIPVDFAETGLRKFQESAFVTGYTFLSKR
ncbi:DUF3010 domain-containing protein [Aliidiomarina taiwanensis]|uniref:DUF3010 domain-containing protein n=1 Tax=Aliidiomarina taiwanensis TaxID=946228 RepID=A0A432XA31_9GAMM|nr:DUF3010 family protein [Aliidiomarina taiwanensis]RUO44262.1 DUF3010 domain-containing protein [Aliidiomarina taiwanensis]